MSASQAAVLSVASLTHSSVSQGDDLDGNYALDEPGDEGEPSDSDAEGSSSEDEEGSDDEAPADDDDLRQSFKKQVGSINQRGDFHRGLRRLRRLGILKDGGDAGASSDSAEEGSDDDDDDEEDEEEGDEEGEEEDEDTGTDDDEDDGGDGDRRLDEPADAVAAAHTQQRTRSELVVAVPKSRRAATAVGELPFTFDAPKTHAEFLGHVDGRSASELGAVIERICACNAIALAPDNRQKLQVFFGILLVHFEMLAQQAPPLQDHLDVLVPHLLVRRARLRFFRPTRIDCAAQRRR